MRLTRLLWTIVSDGFSPVTSHEVLWQVMSECYRVLFGGIPVPSHNILRITIFRERRNYFVNDKLVVVSIVCLIYLSMREFPLVMGVTISAEVSLKSRCFGCPVISDGIINTALKCFQGVVPFLECFEWTRYFGRELVKGRCSESFDFR